MRAVGWPRRLLDAYLFSPFAAGAALPDSVTSFFVRVGFRQQGFELRQVAQQNEVGVLLHVFEVVPAGGDNGAEAGQRVGEVLFLGGLLFGRQFRQLAVGRGERAAAVPAGGQLGTQALAARRVVQDLFRLRLQLPQHLAGLTAHVSEKLMADRAAAAPQSLPAQSGDRAPMRE